MIVLLPDRGMQENPFPTNVQFSCWRRVERIEMGYPFPARWPKLQLALRSFSLALDHFRFSFSTRVTNFEAIQRFGLAIKEGTRSRAIGNCLARKIDQMFNHRFCSLYFFYLFYEIDLLLYFLITNRLSNYTIAVIMESWSTEIE